MMSTTQPIRSKRQIRAISDYFIQEGRYRDNALFTAGVYTALRISDLLNLKWDQIYNEREQTFYSHLYIRERKTDKKRTIAINHRVIEALMLLLPEKKGEYIFSNGRKKGGHISRSQAWRIIHEAADKAGIEGCIACHSLRKTWGYHAWTDQNLSPVIIMQIYNHSSFEVTKRYLGVGQDELDKAYLEMELDE